MSLAVAGERRLSAPLTKNKRARTYSETGQRYKNDKKRTYWGTRELSKQKGRDRWHGAENSSSFTSRPASFLGHSEGVALVREHRALLGHKRGGIEGHKGTEKGTKIQKEKGAGKTVVAATTVDGKVTGTEANRHARGSRLVAQAR